MKTSKATVGLSSPWWAYYHELNAFFERDDEVSVELVEDETQPGVGTMYIKVDNNDKKLKALQYLMPSRVVFGNYTVDVQVVDGTRKSGKDMYDIVQMYEDALAGNDILSFIKRGDSSSPVIMDSSSYIVFRKEVIQYYNDNIADIYCNENTLAEDIAREIFKPHMGINFCTDNK